MSFNLKNRYHMPVTLPIDCQKYLVKTEEWFEGFEEKHRTIDVKAWIRTYLTEDESHIVELANAIRLYIEKEVLGE